jgi:hypothetical protein
VYLKIPLVSGMIAAYTPSIMIGKMSIPNAFLVMFLSTEDEDELPPPPLPLPILLTVIWVAFKSRLSGIRELLIYIQVY